ncbi:MAG: YlmH/Sll1252 family protein [Clostridia bacterium]|nr:YlmH/Sll1252 family protein [Clostridia bacterium]
MEDKLLIARINDLIKQCDKYGRARFSSFLNPAEQVQIEEYFAREVNMHFFGGYEGAQRCMLGIFPDWQEPEEDVFPVTVLKIFSRFGEGLSHRDYLGGVLSLGIDRCKTGDILVEEDGAFVFVSDDIAEYIKSNLRKIGNHGIGVDTVDLGQIVLPKEKTEIFETVAASARLDAVLAAALRISRNNCAKLIKAGKVQVNYKPCEDLSCNLSVGDLICARGFGRLKLDDIGTTTRSGRLHISLKRYI